MQITEDEIKLERQRQSERKKTKKRKRQKTKPRKPGGRDSPLVKESKEGFRGRMPKDLNSPSHKRRDEL